MLCGANLQTGWHRLTMPTVDDDGAGDLQLTTGAATGAPAGGAQPEQQPEQQLSEAQREVVILRRRVDELEETVVNRKLEKNCYCCLFRILWKPLVVCIVVLAFIGSLTVPSLINSMTGSSLPTPCPGIQWMWNVSRCDQALALAQDRVCSPDS